MLRSRKALGTLCIYLLTCSPLLADIKKPPDPLSGLNLEDFQGSNRKGEKNWQSNPFVKYSDTPQTKSLTLYGIIIGPRSLALINSEVVKVGDKIGGSEVVSIERQKVVLRNSDGLFQISFRGSPNDKT